MPFYSFDAKTSKLLYSVYGFAVRELVNSKALAPSAAAQTLTRLAAQLTAAANIGERDPITLLRIALVGSDRDPIEATPYLPSTTR